MPRQDFDAGSGYYSVSEEHQDVLFGVEMEHHFPAGYYTLNGERQHVTFFLLAHDRPDSAIIDGVPEPSANVDLALIDADAFKQDPVGAAILGGMEMSAGDLVGYLKPSAVEIIAAELAAGKSGPDILCDNMAVVSYPYLGRTMAEVIANLPEGATCMETGVDEDGNEFERCTLMRCSLER